jgi:hypothetical protein
MPVTASVAAGLQRHLSAELHILNILNDNLLTAVNTNATSLQRFEYPMRKVKWCLKRPRSYGGQIEFIFLNSEYLEMHEANDFDP